MKASLICFVRFNSTKLVTNMTLLLVNGKSCSIVQILNFKQSCFQNIVCGLLFLIGKPKRKDYFLSSKSQTTRYYFLPNRLIKNDEL